MYNLLRPSVELFIYLPISTFQVQNTDFSHSVSLSVSHHVMVIWRMEHLYVPITLLTPKNLQNKKGTSLISSLSIFRLLYIFFFFLRNITINGFSMNHEPKKWKSLKRNQSNTRAQNSLKIITLKIQSKQPIRGLLTHMKALNQLNGRLYI